jgi:hypothetical protein
MANIIHKVRLPPGCGDNLNEPYLYNPYLHDPNKGFFAALRMRVCLKCKGAGYRNGDGTFDCPKCGLHHTATDTAPRAYDNFLLLSGRQGGKTLGGAHAVREELTIPNSHWWVLGPTYKILHDSTFPTLVKLLNPDWIKRWDPEHTEIDFFNGSKVSFRSLEDPERARGPQGLKGGWFDEAAQCPERGYNVFKPTLLRSNGIIIATTTVLGFDWTYDEIEKRAAVYKEPGYWYARWWTEENPLFHSNAQIMEKLSRVKAQAEANGGQALAFYEQEYRGERKNASGLIYDYQLIEKQTLMTDNEIKKLIPEWPAIHPDRTVLVGLDSGVDHPFGAVCVVVTPKGLVVVDEYLERRKAISQHIGPITSQFKTGLYRETKFSANKNEANLILEWGLRGVGIIKAENKHQVGIQRVQSWLYSNQLYFTYRVPRTIEQMRAYRNADNTKPSTGEKKLVENVFKYKDELPDALRYAIMAWPELPDDVDAGKSEEERAREKRRWNSLDERMQQDILRMREYNKTQEQDENELPLEDSRYPLGDFFGNPDQVQDWLS